MNTLVRNATLRLSHRLGDDFELLNQSMERSGDHYDEKGNNHVSRSKYHHQNQMNILRSVSYRLDRARKIHIFLQTYKLSSMDGSRKNARMKKNLMKKIVGKVNSMVVSIVRSCQSPSALKL
ncbi:hypothetical protein LIER_14104 [Lithospermum erythrorhizon]|uniref:Uncharacterized protein n=1 Tax=Lithospermum erythrorhizon TaxID=34254 RepID=A0AAV3Q2H4_LITER